MGCCLSTATTQKHNSGDQNGPKNQQQQPQLRSPIPKLNAVDCRAPPPPLPPPPAEEESVKEVLSETPLSKPQVPILVKETKPQMPVVQRHAEKFETEDPINKAEENVSEVVSQLSEVCSMSESFSTGTTATVTEKREDEATSKRSGREGTQKWSRSPSDASRKRPCTADGNGTGGRERRVKSPARRPEPSPDKESRGSSRSVRGRESGRVGNRKLNVGSAGVRRDPGEGSGRRSRSPSSARTVGAGGGRSQLKPSSGGVGWKLPPAKGAEKENSGSDKVEEQNDGVPQEESLENPNVSMECFIFL